MEKTIIKGKGSLRDERISCPHCGVTTWSKDYVQFMKDHDRHDGRRCYAAQNSQKRAEVK